MNIFDLDKGRIDLCFIVPRFTKDRSLTIIHLIKEYHLVQKANVWNVRNEFNRRDTFSFREHPHNTHQIEHKFRRAPDSPPSHSFGI